MAAMEWNCSKLISCFIKIFKLYKQTLETCCRLCLPKIIDMSHKDCACVSHFVLVTQTDCAIFIIQIDQFLFKLFENIVKVRFFNHSLEV